MKGEAKSRNKQKPANSNIPYERERNVLGSMERVK